MYYTPFVAIHLTPCFFFHFFFPVFGDWTRLWLRGMTLRSFHYLAPTIPESVYCTYQLTFAIITAALMLGAFADRMKVSPSSQITQSNHTHSSLIY